MENYKEIIKNQLRDFWEKCDDINIIDCFIKEGSTWCANFLIEARKKGCFEVIKPVCLSLNRRAWGLSGGLRAIRRVQGVELDLPGWGSDQIDPPP
jgi:hypothetical protein